MRRGSIAAIACASALCVSVAGSAAYAAEDGCKTGGGEAWQGIYLQSSCSEGGGPDQDRDDAQPAGSSGGSAVPKRIVEYRWSALCGREGQAQDTPTETDRCGIARACPTGDGILASKWLRQLELVNDRYRPSSPWQRAGTECITFDPDNPPEDAARPRVTWQLVLREIKRVGLPALEVQVQPDQRTLVNFETIFYAEPEPFERELRLLGQRVDVRATARTYSWTFGDGSTLETQMPGAPYPSKDIVHEYIDADVTVSPSVDVTYSAEFRVNGGPWREIPETITIDGPADELRILEATAVLVGGDR